MLLDQTAQPTVIADIMFLHERGGYNTLYFTVYFGSLMVRCIPTPLAWKWSGQALDRD